MPDLSSVLDIIVSVLLWLSVAGSVLTILTFTIFSDIRTYPIKLIMFLCACIGTGYSIFFFSFESYVLSSWICWPFAILVHYFFLANFGWCFCIAFNFYQMIVRRNREAEAMEKWYHAGCWGVPFVICLIVAALRYYGRLNNVVCYIDNDYARFAAFFIPGLIIISANAILFFFIGREIHETLAGAPKTDRSERKKEFRVYLSIFISIGLTWVFGYLMFLVPRPKVLQDVFLVIFSVLTPFQGFLIFAFYCINTKVGGKWAGLFGKCFPCCRKWEQMASSTTSSRF